MTDPLHLFTQWFDGFLCGLDGSVPDGEQWEILKDHLLALPRELPTYKRDLSFDGTGQRVMERHPPSSMGGEKPAPVEGTVNFKLSADQLSRMTGDLAEPPAVPRYPDEKPL